MIHLDTHFLIRALASGTPQEALLRQWRTAGEVLDLGVVAWTEFLCGPVSTPQMQIASILFPHPIPFTAEDSPLAAEWFNRTGRRRGSLADCMIAVTAFRSGAQLATQNATDFLPVVPFGLQLVSPP